MMFMKLDHVFEGKVTDNVAVEYKERSIVLG